MIVVNGSTKTRKRPKGTWMQVTKKDKLTLHVNKETTLNRTKWKKGFILPSPKHWDKGFVVVVVVVVVVSIMSHAQKWSWKMS